MCTVLMLARQELILTCYCFDSEQGASVIGQLLRRGVRVKLLLDKNQMGNPSCSKQRLRIIGLFGLADASLLLIRMYSPRGAFSALHAKTWCLDNTLYIGGSFNFTHNANANNEEHLVMLRDPDTVASNARWFYDLWAKSDEVILEEVVRKMIESDDKKAEKKAKRRVGAAVWASVLSSRAWLSWIRLVFMGCFLFRGEGRRVVARNRRRSCQNMAPTK